MFFVASAFWPDLWPGLCLLHESSLDGKICIQELKIELV